MFLNSILRQSRLLYQTLYVSPRNCVIPLDNIKFIEVYTQKTKPAIRIDYTGTPSIYMHFDSLDNLQNELNKITRTLK